MFKKILCATELNDASDEAVKKAIQLAHQYGSKVIMLNVHAEFMTKEEMGMLRVSIDSMKTIFENTAIQAKKEMHDLIEKFEASDIDVEYVISEGKPNQVICEKAKKVKADLIIMGLQKKNVLSSYFIKNTAAYVIQQAIAPVLIVPMKK